MADEIETMHAEDDLENQVFENTIESSTRAVLNPTQLPLDFGRAYSSSTNYPMRFVTTSTNSEFILRLQDVSMDYCFEDSFVEITVDYSPLLTAPVTLPDKNTFSVKEGEFSVTDNTRWDWFIIPTAMDTMWRSKRIGLGANDVVLMNMKRAELRISNLKKRGNFTHQGKTARSIVDEMYPLTADKRDLSYWALTSHNWFRTTGGQVVWRVTAEKPTIKFVIPFNWFSETFGQRCNRFFPGNQVFTLAAAADAYCNIVCLGSLGTSRSDPVTIQDPLGAGITIPAATLTALSTLISADLTFNQRLMSYGMRTKSIMDSQMTNDPATTASFHLPVYRYIPIQGIVPQKANGEIIFTGQGQQGAGASGATELADFYDVFVFEDNNAALFYLTEAAVPDQVTGQYISNFYYTKGGNSFVDVFCLGKDALLKTVKDIGWRIIQAAGVTGGSTIAREDLIKNINDQILFYKDLLIQKYLQTPGITLANEISEAPKVTLLNPPSSVHISAQYDGINYTGNGQLAVKPRTSHLLNITLNLTGLNDKPCRIVVINTTTITVLLNKEGITLQEGVELI